MNMSVNVQRCKEVKKARWGTKKARQAYHRIERREVSIKQTNITEMHLTSGYITISHKRDG